MKKKLPSKQQLLLDASLDNHAVKCAARLLCFQHSIASILSKSWLSISRAVQLSIVVAISVCWIVGCFYLIFKNAI